MKINLAAIISLLFFPSKLKNFILRLLGWKIKPNVYIGFSYIKSKKVFIDNGSIISHGNWINVNSIYMQKKTFIQKLNFISGPLELEMKTGSAIGNLNRIIRAKLPISWGDSTLLLGKLTKITSRHYIECSKSIIFGDFSILAGIQSQIWTHGFIHAASGPDRYRVDGDIEIGNNVYIGSSCTFNPGIKICDAVTIGSNSSVSRSIKDPGLYVNQPLRRIEINYNEGLKKYPKIKLPDEAGIVVYKKSV